MNPTTKMIFSLCGVFLGGVGSYWQLHDNPGVLVTTVTFWIGMVMAGVIPLASYMLGLASKAPWDATPPSPTATTAPSTLGGKP